MCNCYVQHTCSCLCAAYMQLFMCSIHAVVYVQHTCICLCAAYMQLFMCSIHAVIYVQHTCLHTNCIHFFICWYGMRVALSQFLCMQHACNMDVFCVQHACSIHVFVQVCSMYAVYMPNMCMKVAEIYAVCMLYVCCIVHACILHTLCALWHV